MYCMNCYKEVGDEIICPHCGFNIAVQKKALKLSDIYYNEGLDKAQIRDMQGAIDLLTRSLKYNKRNINARNLLGLVYFEIGEVVSALSEWVLSKNISPDDNIATEYIESVRENPVKLETIQQTIKRYNRALDAAKSGEEDVARVMLEKVIDANPKLIKAYYLLALLHMKRGEYEKARRILKKSSPIDRTGATALRFLKDIDEHTGRKDSLSVMTRREKSRKPSLPWLKKKKGRDDFSQRPIPLEETLTEDPVIIPAQVNQPPSFVNLINIVIGIVFGALVVAVIILPTVRQSINRKADEKVTQYSTAMVNQSEHIKELEDKVLKYNEEVNNGNSQISQNQKAISSYEQLLNAYIAYSASNFDTARSALTLVDTTLLSDSTRIIYDSILNDMNTKQRDEAYNNGYNAFQRGKYQEAIPYFVAALKIDENNYSAMDYLAHSYRLNNQSKEALEAFNNIVTKFPSTNRATVAGNYITLIQTGNMAADIGIAQVNSEVSTGAMEGQGN